MQKATDTTLSHITKNKQIIAASIVLSLAAIFAFSAEEFGIRGKIFGKEAAAAKGFVDKAQENVIQPADLLHYSDMTVTDSIMYGGDSLLRNDCPSSQVGVAVMTEDEISELRLRVPILMYHYIEAPGSTTLPWLYESPEIFEAQLRTLANECYNSVFATDAANAVRGEARLPSKPIAITFDDGYDDMYTNAFPLLKKYGMKGTMYIIVNALDTPGYLTRDQVREMADSGFVEIAAHTMNHVDLSKSSDRTAYYEIAGSKSELEGIIGKPVTTFAYPYGFFASRDEAICRQAGYAGCVSTYPGQVQTFAKRYSIYRLRPGYRVGPALINWLEQAGPKI